MHPDGTPDPIAGPRRFHAHPRRPRQRPDRPHPRGRQSDHQCGDQGCSGARGWRTDQRRRAERPQKPSGGHGLRGGSEGPRRWIESAWSGSASTSCGSSSWHPHPPQRQRRRRSNPPAHDRPRHHGRDGAHRRAAQPDRPHLGCLLERWHRQPAGGAGAAHLSAVHPPPR